MEDLLKIALVGTGRASADPPESPVAGLAEAISEADPQSRMLTHAALRTVYETAGRQASSVAELPEPAPEDTTASCTDGAVDTVLGFFRMVHSGLPDLALEAASLLTSQGQSIPPHRLPEFLDACPPSLRDAFRPLVGERGRWLAQFNSEWSWVTDERPTVAFDDEEVAREVWEEAGPRSRTAVLESLRKRDPDKGRAWLEEVWSKEKAEVRQAFLETLAIGLSDADLPFLESLSNDRSEKVRTIAGGLLARLPNSPFSQRMWERANGLLRYEPPAKPASIDEDWKEIPKKPKLGGSLAIEPPKSFESDWKADGLIEKPPTKMGKRAWWLRQILSYVPPSRWSEEFEAAPRALLVASLESDFSRDLLAGWSEASRRFPNAEWIENLWGCYLAQRGDENKGLDGIGQSLAQAFSHCEGSATGWHENLALDAFAKRERFRHLGPTIVAGVPQPWSESFVRGLLNRLEDMLIAFDIDEHLFVRAAAGIPTPYFSIAIDFADDFLRREDAGEVPTKHGNRWQSGYRSNRVETFAETIKQRAHLHQEVERSATEEART